MPTPAWSTFVVFAVLLTAAVAVLARRSAQLLDESIEVGRVALYANLAATQALLLGAVWLLLTWTNVPVETLGVTDRPTILALVALTVALVALNEGASNLTADTDNPLRALLTPERPLEWLVLAGIVLPVIVISEEVLFRGVLIGGLAAGTGIHPAVLIVGSGLLFGLAHTAQGRLGMLVASTLGVALGVAFWLSGSLWLVILAHYLVDLVEFLRHARFSYGSRFAGGSV
ncbi:CPBP family intramembrane glutamic endopeptidase [Halodesulfurarchaeum sp. HSR-GB]|uniref:CPBP family intramembrane glutamic endopeptidase n=1 Tax=Halodesulfurarchaeum sp. HSR-GB TaxID=3074077 RepID=UPI00285FFF82|nr:CPBP family intramembrane glutamic endopeptidase [Halodesulfurarchaeum sp. HSR-GB]MDR5656780.1 CPBP family intramembrane glutamic endopeptidase [Halodesulfurarchaeum sp. HSR-GB]